MNWPQNTMAVPVFARLYKTSCLTCHVAPPKLTPFGEAFRLNGYQIPEDDGESVKEEPLAMAAEAYKKVWPKAVWPGAVPGTVPLSFRAKSGMEASREDTVWAPSFVPPTLQIMLAGTLGEDVTFFAGAHLFELGKLGSVDRFFLQFDNLFDFILPAHLMYLKVGQFVPELVPFTSNHRSLTLTPYAFNTYDPSFGRAFAGEHAHGGPSFGIETFQIGVEINGIALGRLRYVAGLVNGSGPNTLDDNPAKDFYGRLAYKIGGKALAKGGDVASQTGQNWIDNSLQVGFFGYKGAKKNIGFESPDILDFYRFGGDFNLNLWNLNLYGGVIAGGNEHVDDIEQQVGMEPYLLFFTEADYLLLPWLMPVIRYERAKLGEEASFGRVVSSLTVLIRANTKLIIESPVDFPDPHFQRLQLGLDYSF
jgi:hypothetical protein